MLADASEFYTIRVRFTTDIFIGEDQFSEKT